MEKELAWLVVLRNAQPSRIEGKIMDMLFMLILGIALPSLLCGLLVLPVGYTKVYFGNNGVFVFFCVAVLILSLLMGRFASRAGRKVNRPVTKTPTASRMNYRDNWMAYYQAEGGETVIAYQDKKPSNGRGRLVFIDDETGARKPFYQILGTSYRTFDGTRVLWNSEIPDGS